MHHTSGIKLLEGCLYAAGNTSGGYESFIRIQGSSVRLSLLGLASSFSYYASWIDHPRMKDNEFVNCTPPQTRQVPNITINVDWVVGR